MKKLTWSEKLAELAKEANAQGWWIATELVIISTKVALLEDVAEASKLFMGANWDFAEGSDGYATHERLHAALAKLEDK